MKSHHYVILALIIFIAYIAGAKYPAIAQKVGLS